MTRITAAAAAIASIGLASTQAVMAAPTLLFSTGDPDGRMATATRPGATPGPIEIESADDFVLTNPTTLTGASFTGLFVPPPGGVTGSVTDVVVEIYRVFPADSDTTRTPNVPTRVNSPSDNALDSRDSSTHQLEFSTTDLGPFTAANSVQPGGIHAKPGQTTTGNGPVTGDEVRFDVSFTDPFSLDAGHYFFVPQVALDSFTNNNFLWLSAPRPIVDPGTPFPAGFTDLQSWTRDANLDPDWLRVGQDIVGGSPFPTFNATFSLTGVVPEPGTFAVLGTGLLGLAFLRRPTSRQ
jgi:hypothetical protein